ncbi:hypothetical protein PCANB_000192 [Pneumocystis canis]|nr:hypothetical protein PCANB_000192 [Pneumocystis canis]
MLQKDETVVHHSFPVPHTIVTCGSTRSIHLQDWSVTSTKGSILTSEEIQKFSSQLSMPIPEMTFGKNQVIMKHSSGWRIAFVAYDALEAVDKTGKEVIQVSYANEWVKKREKSCEGIGRSKCYDWTFTTTYQGTISLEDDDGTADKVVEPTGITENNENVKKVIEGEAMCVGNARNTVLPSFVPSSETIPLDKLKRQDPILFFEEIVLYEDELSDNGLSVLNVKVRVMPERLLLLQRFFMRLDNVIFRIRDTRIYIEFATSKVLREYIEKEAPYHDVLQKVPLQQNDYSAFLTNPIWVASGSKSFMFSTLSNIYHDRKNTNFQLNFFEKFVLWMAPVMGWYRPRSMSIRKTKELYICCSRQGVQNVDSNVWYSKHSLPPSFQTWFHITILHVWMLMVRIRIRSERIISLYMKDLLMQFHGSILAYDEGLYRNDYVLASALWRNLYAGKTNIKISLLAASVLYVRNTLYELDNVSDYDIQEAKVFFLKISDIFELKDE